MKRDEIRLDERASNVGRDYLDHRYEKVKRIPLKKQWHDLVP